MSWRSGWFVSLSVSCIYSWSLFFTIELCLSDLKDVLFNPHQLSQWRECHVQLTFILFCKCKECHHQNRLSCVLSLQKKIIYYIFIVLLIWAVLHWRFISSLNKCQCEFVILFNRAAATHEEESFSSLPVIWKNKRWASKRIDSLMFLPARLTESCWVTLPRSPALKCVGCVSFFFVTIEMKVINPKKKKMLS